MQPAVKSMAGRGVVPVLAEQSWEAGLFIQLELPNLVASLLREAVTLSGCAGGPQG